MISDIVGTLYIFLTILCAVTLYKCTENLRDIRHQLQRNREELEDLRYEVNLHQLQLRKVKCRKYHLQKWIPYYIPQPRNRENFFPWLIRNLKFIRRAEAFPFVNWEEVLRLSEP